LHVLRDTNWPLTGITFVKQLLLLLALVAACLIFSASFSLAEETPRGLDPLEDATYIPELGGLLNKTMHNHYGQKRDLAECIVLRRSSVKDGKVFVPAGGLFYASSTSESARPLMRDPFLLLGEESYLIRMSSAKVVKTDVKIKTREKALIDPSGYRIWFDYATDHYGKPYGEFALIAPSGGWPMEWPISTSFPEPSEAKSLNVQGGINPQQKEFFISNSYIFGATRLTAKEITHKDALFSRIEYPAITEAVFSMDRPWVLDIQQESYRWFWNKRIYAFRKEDGVLVEVRDWTGKKVLASKLLKPSTQQEYKIAEQDKMCLTRFDLDLHIELVVDPSWFKGSDFTPWANGVPYGWKEGTIAFMVYDDLIKLKDGEPWPRDDRYIVRLEPDLMTGMLKRVVLENREPFVLSKENSTHAGPVKISEVWDRKYFNVVLGKIDNEVVKNCYVRDSFFRRTDNLILWKEGKENMDFFIGMSELVVSVMEDTFLQRLADPSYGVPVVRSRFTSYPPVIPSAKWFAPDPDCAFVPKMKGFKRKFVRNRKKERLVAAEALVIRGSYVDYRKRKIVIPPAGLYYTTRNNRNIRPLAGESFYILGRKAYLLSTQSYLVVKKNFKIDLWKEMPMGDGNLLFWQDVPLGDGSKAFRYIRSSILWGRPTAILRVTKYSGNTWGANLIVAPGFHSYADLSERPLLEEGISPQDYNYFLPDMFAEGATYLIPRWVSPDFVDVAEMGTPGMDSFTMSYNRSKKVVLREGEDTAVGDYRLKVAEVDTINKKVKLLLLDAQEKVATEKILGPLTKELYDTLPQYSPSQQKVMLQYDDIHVELDLPTDFPDGKVPLYISTGVLKLKRDTPWQKDPRFIMRPDVCGHCYMLNEFILDNRDPIVLDGENNTFIGPEGYFKIVIDDFDGEAINAWHIEDRTGMKTPNLAEYPRNNLDVMVGVNGTVESFLRRTVLKRLAYREIWRLK